MSSIASTLLLDQRYEVPAEPVRRFTVDEYHQLIREGFFAKDERYELLEGWIVSKMPREPRHDAAIGLLEELVRRQLPAGWYVRTQCAATTTDSEPEPDLMVVRGGPRDYVDHHPNPADAALVVEIANTTLSRDRGTKARLYAQAGVREYWIVNLVENQVEVCTEPTGAETSPRFQKITTYRIGEAVPLRIGDVIAEPILVSTLLP